MSEYVEFYRGKRTTPLGNFDIHAVLDFDDKLLEKEHGFVPVSYTHLTLPTKRIV